MTEKIQKLLNDSKAARWTALILIALMMFFGYMFVDVMSPLKTLVENSRGWDSGVFGTYASAEYILNVCGFLIVAGIITEDKTNPRTYSVTDPTLLNRIINTRKAESIVPEESEDEGWNDSDSYENWESDEEEPDYD